VTESWNKAIDFASSDYVMLFGDDDGLAPNFSDDFAKYITDFEQPDVLYANLFQAIYPGVKGKNTESEFKFHICFTIKENTVEIKNDVFEYPIYKYGFHILIPNVMVKKEYKKYLFNKLKSDMVINNILLELGAIDAEECLDQNSASVPVLFLGTWLEIALDLFLHLRFFQPSSSSPRFPQACIT
jgi:hypothetical protein